MAQFTFPAAVDPDDLAEAIDLPFVTGSLAALEPGTILLNQSIAKSLDEQVGDQVEMEMQGGTVKLDGRRRLRGDRGAAGRRPGHLRHLREGRDRAARLDGLRRPGARARTPTPSGPPSRT